MRSSTELVFVMCAVTSLSAKNCSDKSRLKSANQNLELQNATLKAENDYQKQVELNLQYKIEEIKDRIQNTCACKTLEEFEAPTNYCKSQE